MRTQIFNYPLKEYNFTDLLEGMLEVNNLSEIECESVIENKTGSEDYSMYKNMEHTRLYKKLYDKLDSDEGDLFYQTYRSFIKEVIRPQYNEPIYYQAKPTHRILYKNVEGVSRFHRDADYGHHPSEINYFVPQTVAENTNTIWIESEEGKGDFTPINVQLGQFARFKGVTLMHGAKKNRSGKTRVSFDFRIIPSSDWPGDPADTSNWNEEDKKNKLFQNAHNFTICK